LLLNVTVIPWKKMANDEPNFLIGTAGWSAVLISTIWSHSKYLTPVFCCIMFQVLPHCYPVEIFSKSQCFFRILCNNMSTNIPANDEPNFLIGTAGWLLCWSIKSEAGNICIKLICLSTVNQQNIAKISQILFDWKYWCLY